MGEEPRQFSRELVTSPDNYEFLQGRFHPHNCTESAYFILGFTVKLKPLDEPDNSQMYIVRFIEIRQ